MIRKFLVTAAALALSLGLFAFDASAQVCRDYNDVIVACPRDTINYPTGGLSSGSPRPTPAPTSSAVPSADNVAATSDSSGSGSSTAIAFTGSESQVLGYVGAGLIGFGAVALIAARRRSEIDTDLD